MPLQALVADFSLEDKSEDVLNIKEECDLLICAYLGFDNALPQVFSLGISFA